MSIIDDGVGFIRGDAAHAGLGLAGMEERAIVLGSRLSIASRPGRGTRISVSAPLRARTAAERSATKRSVATSRVR